MSQDDDQLVERVARALAANDAQNGRSPHLHYSEYADIMWIPMARAALSAMPQRELLAEALDALTFVVETRDCNHFTASDTFRDYYAKSCPICRARAAADKIRAALDKGEPKR